MAKEFDRVKFNVSGTPGTGTVTIGSRYNNSVYLPTEQGAVNGDEVFYILQKTNGDEETGFGTIGGSVTTVSRDIVTSSIIGGTKGTSKIDIDSAAFMAFVTPSFASKSLTVVRTVTETTDTLVSGDGGGQITYNSASAVAVSIAQAGTAGLYKGLFVFVRNIAAGAVTITPTTSTINGASTLVLANGDSALIWSDGANFQAIVWRGIDTDSTMSADSDTRIPSQKAVKAHVAAAISSISAVLPNYLTGLTLSAAGSTGTFGIAAGAAADSANAALMTLASAYTKTTSAWAVGAGNGALDTGTIANNTWYHVWLIQRSDTGVVDILISTSATSPTMPTNYDRKRRIGSMRTDGSTPAYWIKFFQDGDDFVWDGTKVDINGVNSFGTTAVLQTLTVPNGVKVVARYTFSISQQGSTAVQGVNLQDPSIADTAGSVSTASFYMQGTGTGAVFGTELRTRTNTSGQIRVRCQGSAADLYIYLTTSGWTDRRGRDG